VTLYDQLPRGDDFSSDVLLGRFLDYVTGRGLELYPAQEEAILELFEDKNVILNADRFREIARGLGLAFPSFGPRSPLGLHLSDQGVGEREVHGALP